MIKVENIDVYGFEAAIRGMRNPMNSWKKSDSGYVTEYDEGGFDAEFYNIGENDLALMKSLVKAGTDHRKFLRMINVTCDIVAPLYWWKEYDTYKVGTVANSCSTMHKIADKEFTLDDFSHEHLCGMSIAALNHVIDAMNLERKHYIVTGDKDCWWQMIQLLPSSYNQRRTGQLNYEVLLNMYHARKNHKLDEWREFCKAIETLPYFKEICLGDDENG